MMADATMTSSSGGAASFPPRSRATSSSGSGSGKGPNDLDRGLIDRCRSQDAMAFRAFVVRYERMVFALLSRMLGRQQPEALVEDLAQETFVRAYRAFPNFDPDGAAKVSTWLLTISTRLVLDDRKKKKLDIEEIDESAEAKSAATPSTPELHLERRELGQALAEAAALLPDDQRAALVLAEMHGLSIAEIASALDVPENTAKTRLFRAREKMRTAMADWRTQ
jgi:RNA polymerase sigma-70 factor, ECF subfamily